MKPGVIISKRLLAVGSASSMLNRGLQVSILVWLNQYLIKRIDAAEYSLLPIVMSLMLFAPLLTAVLTSGIGRFVVAAHSRREDDRVKEIVSSIFPILLMTSGVILAVGGWVAWNIDRFLSIAPGRKSD